MNQPTRDEHEQLKERVKKIEEQQTEPIQITVERRYPDHDMLQDISRKQDEQDRLLLAHSRGISTLQTEMQGARADIMSIKATQSDHGELLREHSKRFDTVEARFDTIEARFDRQETTQDEQGVLLRAILARLPEPGN